MRHALDYLVYELSSPRERERRNTQFPIFDDERRFREVGAQWIKSIKGDERTLIERVQPYNAAKLARSSPLFVLNTLANQDKHRLLLPVAAAANQLALGSRVPMRTFESRSTGRAPQRTALTSLLSLLARNMRPKRWSLSRSPVWKCN